MDASTIISLVVIGLVIWLVFYLINKYLPDPFRTVANVLLVVVVILWLLSLIGIVHGIGGPILHLR
jgi:cell division protein FtsX